MRNLQVFDSVKLRFVHVNAGHELHADLIACVAQATRSGKGSLIVLPISFQTGSGASKRL